VLIEHDDDPDDLSGVTEEIATAELRPFLLVEKNVRGCNPPTWYSTHDSPAEAGAYYVGQEYREDWEPVGLWDLDTGERFDPVVGMTFEAHR
jgi:hypothetical protein